MSYIGNPPLTGSYKKLDDISSGFNGSTTTFNLTSSSDAVTPGSPNALIISLGGVVQEPTSSYTVSGSTITFTTAPAASTTFWGVMLGDTLYVGVSQGTVTPSMLSTGGPSWDTSGNATVSGNLTFSGTAKRILGDFSNATVANRVMFQTSTTNGATNVYAIPNGTGTIATWTSANNSDPTNAGVFQLAVTVSDARLNSTITGTGTYLPVTVYTSGSERMRIDTSGNVGIGTTTLNASGSTKSLAIGSSTATDYAGLEFQTAGSLRAYMNATNGAFYIASASTNPTVFYTNSSERVRITANGGVAFGGASNYGTSGQVLTSNGDAAPTWGTVSGTPAGSVVAFAGSSAPSGWLLCSGAAVSRSTYAALFAVIGTTYGAGDGSTTFNLPDLRGRAVAGVDNMGGTAANRITSGGSGITGTTLGAAGGAQTFTLSTNEMPSHNHTYYAYPSGGSSAYPYWVTNTQNSPQGFSTTNAGGGGASNVTQPTMMLNYIIKT